MELWLCSRINGKTVMLKNSWFQQILPPASTLADAGWHTSHLDVRVLPSHGSGVAGGQVQVRQTNTGRPEQVVIHGDESEHPVHYITSTLRGEGCMLMTFWLMTDSVSIRSGDGSQRDWTGQWPSWKLSAQGFKGNVVTQSEKMLMWFMSLKCAFSEAFIYFKSFIIYQLNKCW